MPDSACNFIGSEEGYRVDAVSARQEDIPIPFYKAALGEDYHHAHAEKKTVRRIIVYFVALRKKSKALRPIVRIGTLFQLPAHTSMLAQAIRVSVLGLEIPVPYRVDNPYNSKIYSIEQSDSSGRNAPFVIDQVVNHPGKRTNLPNLYGNSPLGPLRVLVSGVPHQEYKEYLNRLSPHTPPRGEKKELRPFTRYMFQAVAGQPYAFALHSLMEFGHW
ncbi:hypothetical protein L211DRAFT_852238 [Terfezia boudieri ATCC MYA-4762]|uniref:Uncharacterized protein n=1 Tax=Terfezia boudieri ATCC MYA-4762 TaxID=1051890 RepID=A0A3N4LC98_9PEZI|nr:hypothetical protein L211DRAFT_852238 [Terfezia boudieri ATCC MYA-4762]